MNILADRYDAEFRGQNAMQLRQQAEDEMNKSDHESIELIMQWYYGVICHSLPTLRKGETVFLPGSRLIHGGGMIFIFFPNNPASLQRSRLVQRHHAITSKKFYDIYEPGSQLVFTRFRGPKEEKVTYDVCQNQKDVDEAKRLISQQKIDEERFAKALLKKARKKIKPIWEPQPGDSSGELWEPLCMEHIAFRAARSAKRILTFK